MSTYLTVCLGFTSGPVWFDVGMIIVLRKMSPRLAGVYTVSARLDGGVLYWAIYSLLMEC